jgi:hypothetical protein
MWYFPGDLPGFCGGFTWLCSQDAGVLPDPESVALHYRYSVQGLTPEICGNFAEIMRGFCWNIPGVLSGIHLGYTGAFGD